MLALSTRVVHRHSPLLNMAESGKKDIVIIGLLLEVLLMAC